jgi:hypothetical protein
MTGRFRPWMLAAGSCLLAVLAILLTVAGSDGSRSTLVAEPSYPHRVDVITGSPPALPALPAGSATDLSPASAAADPYPSEPPLPAPVTPTTRPAPAPGTPTRPVAPVAPRPPVVSSYEAESSVNSLSGTRTFNCPGCSAGRKVGNIGGGKGTLTFNGVTATAGPATLTLVYVNGEDTRIGQLSVDGGPPVTLSFPGTGGWSTVGTLTLSVQLRAGENTFRLSGGQSPAPDYDRIVLSVPAR